MLERLTGNKYLCFLDGFSGYFQIPIDPIDQEKTTFTCPFGTYAYRRIPFGLCNAPATFQRCMLEIFHDMIEESVKVFMEDFSVFGNSFDKCLNNLDKMLQHCKDTHLVLKWEICNFMVKEGIVLGHKVSSTGLEVDKAKIDVISKLPPPTNIKGLLEKDTPFEFNDECQKAFKSVKEKLTCAPVIVSSNWNLPFELMCDASDFAVGAVLEFDIEIKDKKVIENVAADHLSRIENDESSNDSKLDDNFPGETLMGINTKDEPWFTYFANYLVADIIPKGMTYQQKNKLFSNLKHYFWEEPYLFKVYYDGMIRRCALKNCNPDLIAAGEQRMFQLHELDELRHQAYENSRLYKARTNVWHDRKLRMRKEFKHGNKVLLFHSKYKFRQPKLRSRWLGPCVVKHQDPSGYVELYGKYENIFIVNGHRLKLYHEEEDYNDKREAVTPFFPKE
ncbi:reverse transcriptase domain-containing protein [Tanacetum coccineum]